MMRFDRATAWSGAVFVFAATLVLAPAATAVATGAPPFCVARGGSQGDSSAPQICAYFDYQVCLQAAAELHGNCVQNIDYHGEVSTAPARGRAQRRR